MSIFNRREDLAGREGLASREGLTGREGLASREGLAGREDPRREGAPATAAAPGVPSAPATRSSCLSSFVTALHVLRGHWVYVVIYLVALSMMGVFVAMGSTSDVSADDAVLARPQAAVIDRDGSAVSRGVAGYVARYADLVEVADTERALQDAAAEDRVAYVLVIPEGYGDALVRAARAGSDAPALQTVVSFQSAAGSLVDIRVVGYLRSLYGFAALLGVDQDEAVRLADETTAQDAAVGVARTSDTPLATRLRVYLGFSTYPLFAAISLCIALLMKSFNDREVRRRMLVAPASSASRSVQVFAACLVVGLASWLWIAGLGAALFGAGVAAVAPGRVAVACLALLAYALFAVAFGFLLGQLGVKEQAANAVANVGGLVMSFLGGAWVGMELMPDAIVEVARFTPSFWAVDAVDQALFAADAGAALGSVGIAALFALAVFAAALAVGRVRVREA